MTYFFLLALPVLALANSSPPAVTPCTVGINAPCLPSSTCTPTQISTTNQPWLGQCIATPSVPVVAPCTVGIDAPCLPRSTCTPTQISTTNQPWLGQCIATPSTPAISTSGPIISATPPILTITALPTPPSSTECHVGWEHQCNTGSTCTPTMTCYRLLPCGGKCIATPAPTPSSAPCNVGWESQCGPSSTCTPIETCFRLRPCRGSCIATATPPVVTSTPILTITRVPTPSVGGQCMVGWEAQCHSGSTCTPIETCYRLRPCRGSCIATATPPAVSSCA